ncbi:MAG: excinuclease ABC subunit UvrB [Bacilli bacterium]|nr:excinuclease ABC subunit UvrB [Bacilli bacterium]MBP3635544.1 excinuclease ABC subunit UvrB [Bacilli bacterium]
MFKLVSKYKPSGDQPEAIDELVQGLNNGKRDQVLLGATGTGKTFTIANVIERVNKPTLVLAHNKTLAGQLYAEFKELFPENRVEYFVSYYDYYQPEAYVPSSDTFIEKDASINDEIDELRHSATSALISRDDVIVVASVSCIYGLGEKEEYENKTLSLKVGDVIDRDEILKKLVDMLYERNNMDLVRGTFRTKGDTIEIVPAYSRTNAYRIDLFGDEVEKLIEFDTTTGAVINQKQTITIFAASHFVTSDDKLKLAVKNIREELNDRLKYFKDNNKLLELQRLEQRTNYDLEMLSETGFCKGIENYSRHLAFKKSGEAPTTLIDFFPKDFLLVIDESHVTLPQVRAMYNGDRMRKTTLVEYGFRLPSALDNRPLKFDEFERKINQVIYVSATPGDYELDKTHGEIVEQIIRPTGLLDPTIEVKPSLNQIDDLIEQIQNRISKNERTLVTTLTIRMSEELTNYLKNVDIKVAYLHNEIKTLERMEIVRDLRLGKYDVVVGVNLLREGIDIPEVSLIAILDADKQGFLRSERSLIQTIGRAARNSNGHVIMYADSISDAMDKAIKETQRRRCIQSKYNEENNIIPKTIIKDIRDVIKNTDSNKDEKITKTYSKKEKQKIMDKIEKEMMEAAKGLDFERATELRDILFEMKME